MRKSTILIISVLTLAFVAGSTLLMANSYWSGTGTGNWYYPDTHLINPFKYWSGTFYTDSNPKIFKGVWWDDLGHDGVFRCVNWSRNSAWGTWRWAPTAADEGTCWMEFDFDNSTCAGEWESEYPYGTGSGTWSGTE